MASGIAPGNADASALPLCLITALILGLAVALAAPAHAQVVIPPPDDLAQILPTLPRPGATTTAANAPSSSPSPAPSTMTADEARSEARSLGGALRGAMQTIPQDPASAGQVPGYDGNYPDETRYYNQSDSLPGAGAAAAGSSEGYRAVNAAGRPKVDVTRDDLKRAAAIERDPAKYTGGTGASANGGECTQLPPGTARSTTAEFTCNIGAAVTESDGTCTRKLKVTQWNEIAYSYLCVTGLDDPGCASLAGDKLCTRTARTLLPQFQSALETWRCDGPVSDPQVYLLGTEMKPPPASAFRVDESIYRCNRQGLDAALALDPLARQPIAYLTGLQQCAAVAAAPTCTRVQAAQAGLAPRTLCRTWQFQGGSLACTETAAEEEIYSCTGPIQGLTAEKTATRWFTETWGPEICSGNAGTCTQTSTTCTAVNMTRLVDGTAVTRPCWEKTSNLRCQHVVGGNSDCGELSRTPGCNLAREICLDDPASADGHCAVKERVYVCPVPATTSPPPQYLCGEDVYCVNGNCESVNREASDEFKDAVAALNALGQANAEFDENSLTLFQGTRETCSHKVFGLSNCCSGSGVPILTPWLCSASEQQLDKKDDAGLCHKLGSYCSSKILGICVTKKDAYCCFQSRISRILQEQGRGQIGKPWASPKEESCPGFGIGEFQRLDLSAMDFSEVYAEFMEAARLPDEAAALAEIQNRIRAYAAGHSGSAGGPP